MSLDRLKEDKKDIFILITVFEPSIYEVVYRQLSNFGFAREQMMNAKNMVERYPISYLKENLEQYKKVYPLLQDDLSKETYLAMIQKAYLDTDISRIVCREQDEYFDKAVILTDEEVFVDCGGYDGDTAIQFIVKMDIEGAEIEALKGCKKIIQRYKPKLAICIYHKPEDLFAIPLLIKEMRDDHKLLIRQYRNSRFETVCYAI